MIKPVLEKPKSCCHEISLGTPEKHGGVFLVRIMSDTICSNTGRGRKKDRFLLVDK